MNCLLKRLFTLMLALTLLTTSIHPNMFIADTASAVQGDDYEYEYNYR